MYCQRLSRQKKANIIAKEMTFIANVCHFIAKEMIFIANFCHIIAKEMTFIANVCHFIAKELIFIANFCHFIAKEMTFIANVCHFICQSKDLLCQWFFTGNERYKIAYASANIFHFIARETTFFAKDWPFTDNERYDIAKERELPEIGCFIVCQTSCTCVLLHYWVFITLGFYNMPSLYSWNINVSNMIGHTACNQP